MKQNYMKHNYFKPLCILKCYWIYILLVTITPTKTHAQNFEGVAINAVVLGANTENALFTASSGTIANLAFVRAIRIVGPATGYFAFVNDNISYQSSSSGTATIKFDFLDVSQNPIAVTDLRFIVNDLDGPNNEGIATQCGNSLNFIATAEPTNLSIDTAPPLLSTVGTVVESDGATSRVAYEFNNVSSVEFNVTATSADLLKEFDMNNNDFPLTTAPIYSVCLDDSDGDLITDDIDIDDDNDGILDVTEAGGNHPNGDHDGDGLPNYLDVSDDTGASVTYIANADGTNTDYTDLNLDGSPDVYHTGNDLDALPNHLDIDSDDDGCFDVFEAGFTDLAGDGTVDGTGFNPDGTVIGSDGYGNPVDIAPANGTADYMETTFTLPDAGPNQSLTITNATLAGNTPDSGIGTWTLISGLGTITNPNSPTSTITNLGQGTAIFQWSFSNATCTSESVDQVALSVNLMTTLNTNDFSKINFKMYPNPTEGDVTISIPLERIEIHDFLGKKVFETKESSFSISELPSGIYFVSVESKKRREVRKLIKK